MFKTLSGIKDCCALFIFYESEWGYVDGAERGTGASTYAGRTEGNNDYISFRKGEKKEARL